MSDSWYRQTSTDTDNNDWYAPVPREDLQSAPEKKLSLRWLRPVIAAVLVIALIAGSSWAFGSRGAKPADNTPAPSDAPKDEHTAPPPDLFEDFREFFDNYYSPQEEHEECTIPTVNSFPGRTLELHPAGSGELTLQEVYAKCAPSVVAVTAFIEDDSDERYYWGTGIVLSADGYIVTNAHVVEGSCRARITLWNDEEYDALLVGYDSRSDIAVLKIEARGLTPGEFCDPEDLSIGDQVVAIGNPLGREFRSTMTEGIISGIDRDISYNGITQTLLQTSAPINEGNSGGPLINMAGQVIGITNMKMSNSAGSVTIEGVGFAIPSRTVKSMADSILSCGSVVGRPALGLTLGPIPDSARTQYDLPEGGLYVSAVSKGSDCEAKGILPGDIITAVNGDRVSTTNDVTDVIAERKVGDTMTLTVWRKVGDSHREFDVTVVLKDVIEVY